MHAAFERGNGGRNQPSRFAVLRVPPAIALPVPRGFRRACRRGGQCRPKGSGKRVFRPEARRRQMRRFEAYRDGRSCRCRNVRAAAAMAILPASGWKRRAARVGFADDARVISISVPSIRPIGRAVWKFHDSRRDGRRAREPGNAAAHCGFKTAADGAGKLLRLFERGFVGNAQAPAIMRRAALRGGRGGRGSGARRG